MGGLPEPALADYLAWEERQARPLAAALARWIG
jgi:hypothetical protein